MTDETRNTLSAWGLDLTPQTLARLETFASGLKEKNTVQNLVSKNDMPLLWERHILDSLSGALLLRRLLKPGAVIADAGSGAGFPGLVLAAVLEEFSFELLDSRGKRCDFLGWAAESMLCKNVSVFQRRVGEGGPGSERRYAAVIERAMGQLENILPQCLNILKAGGYFLAWQSAAQLARSRPGIEAALTEARGTLAETVSYRLPAETEDRHILVFRKR
jgi:16S rRNA (guanine527-N7)-methyltransferase